MYQFWIKFDAEFDIGTIWYQMSDLIINLMVKFDHQISIVDINFDQIWSSNLIFDGWKYLIHQNSIPDLIWSINFDRGGIKDTPSRFNQPWWGYGITTPGQAWFRSGWAGGKRVPQIGPNPGSRLALAARQNIEIHKENIRETKESEERWNPVRNKNNKIPWMILAG